MSDIIYNPPASGGGTTINPTNEFIPVRSNSTTFIDSCLRNTTTQLTSQYLGVKKGIILDFSNGLYSLGDFNLSTNGTMFEVDQNTQKVYTKNINEPRGIYIDFATRKYLYGDWNNYYNGTSIYVDDNSEYIQTRTNNSVKGINLNFASNNYTFGDNATGNLMSLDASIDRFDVTLNSKNLLKIDEINHQYAIGDWNAVSNIGVSLSLQDGGFIAGTFNGIIDGLFLDYASNTYQLGQITTNSQFTIDAANEYAQITLNSIQYMLIDQINGTYSFGEYGNGTGLEFNNSNNEFVLLQQSFEYIVVGNNTTYFGQRANFSYKIDYNTSILSIGDNAYTINETLFVVDMIQDIICTQTLSSRKGLLIDFPNKKYSLGDFNNTNNKTYLHVDDGNNLIYFNTNNLTFNGSNLQSNSSGGNSGEHLVITLNGVAYKIKLEFP